MPAADSNNQPGETQAAPDFQPRCLRCFRPQKLCYCSLIPSVANRTDVLILQHRREREHPFNTARMVDMALDRCRLIVENNDVLARRMNEVTLADDAAVLYPGDDVPLLTDLPVDQRPSQLIVLDGTWHHTKTLMRDIPRLATLPRFKLAPPEPGRYRIRREPDDQALSTLEAVIAALADNEPETPGLALQLAELMQAFDRIIDQQIANPKSNWRVNSKRVPDANNVPKALRGTLENIVVAYGEQEQGDYRPASVRPKPRVRPPKSKVPPRPVYWVAQRLVTGERFEMVIQADCLGDEYFRDQIGLDDAKVGTAVSLDEFRESWQGFLRKHDTVVVRHPGTEKLITRNEVSPRHPCLVLKSIKADESADANAAAPMNDTRAAQRLANTIALTQHFSSLASMDADQQK
ncbi:tRNA-uridine aminocarboxypropyltransferase [Rubripirellula lacrimiformis]|uniref:tRNA-uridine aminocarboxypropyltransferase n=1 Tax=Rubripirellula lacrimiformis TaxID=1930273 RepID=UPI001C54C6E5|nr:tRNA-uridine aminocarboxypropyltransferase [Rubripirellula lacrimiformis]